MANPGAAHPEGAGMGMTSLHLGPGYPRVKPGAVAGRLPQAEISRRILLFSLSLPSPGFTLGQ